MIKSEPVITHTMLQNMKLKNRGKTRDIYDFGDALLIVATDRISAFDVIMNEGIPFKGKVLTQISEYWFEQTKDIIQNHFISSIIYDFPSECKPHWDVLRDRSLFVKKTKPLAVECIVRGYLFGSCWNEYISNHTISGIKLPVGLVQASKLPEPIITPSTKAVQGSHDENISFEEMKNLIGKEMAEKVRDISINIYKRGVEIADSKGIIVADTKFEFGVNEDGELILIDELLTPDSSRFWLKEKYKPGRAQDGFDKQFLRDYLSSVNFNKKPPAPKLPEDIILKTSALYLEALKRLSDRTLV